MSPSPIPLCGHWSAGSDSSSLLNHPKGPEPTCSPHPFVQTSTYNIRKRFEPPVPQSPQSPNLTSGFFFFFKAPPSLFPHPLFHLCLFLSGSFPLLFPLNLHLPPMPLCKGIFCTGLMERLLSNKDRSRCGTTTTNRIFCGQSGGALSSAVDRGVEKKGNQRLRESFSQIYPSRHPQLSREKLGVCALQKVRDSSKVVSSSL